MAYIKLTNESSPGNVGLLQYRAKNIRRLNSVAQVLLVSESSLTRAKKIDNTRLNKKSFCHNI
jgi:hypothetical protein